MKTGTKITAALLSGLLFAGCAGAENKAETNQNQSSQSENTLEKDFQDKKTSDVLKELVSATFKANGSSLSIEQVSTGNDTDEKDRKAADDETRVKTDIFMADGKLYTAIDDGVTLTYSTYAKGTNRIAVLMERNGSTAYLADEGEADDLQSDQEALEATLQTIDLLDWNLIEDTHFKTSFEAKDGYTVITLSADADELTRKVSEENGTITGMAGSQQADVKALSYTLSVNDKGLLEKIEKHESIDFSNGTGTFTIDSNMTATLAPYKADTDLKETMDYVFEQIDQKQAVVDGSISLDHAAAEKQTKNN